MILSRESKTPNIPKLICTAVIYIVSRLAEIASGILAALLCSGFLPRLINRSNKNGMLKMNIKVKIIIKLITILWARKFIPVRIPRILLLYTSIVTARSYRVIKTVDKTTTVIIGLLATFLLFFIIPISDFIIGNACEYRYSLAIRLNIISIVKR